MNRIIMALLIVSILGNLFGIFVLYKALAYRKNMILAWAATEEWVSKSQYPPATDSARAASKKIVLLGASITQLWELERYFGADHPFVNKGINGQFSGQYLLRFKRDVIDCHPKAVVIKLCAINITRNIPFEISRDNVIVMTQLAQANGIQPILASTIPVTEEFDRRRSPKDITQEIKEFNTWLKSYAQQHQFLFLDFFSAMSDDNGYLKPELSRDGLHPNDRGYEVMSRLMKLQLKDLMMEPS